MKKIEVLLVEDNPDDVELLRDLSAEITSGFLNITHADCLSEGIRLVSEQKFDIVILDLFLPDSAGLDTLAAFGRIAGDLPIIVMTSLNDEEFATESVHQGAQDYLIKGQLDSDLLWRSIRYAIERKGVLAQLEELRQHERQSKEIDSLKAISGASSTDITARFLGINPIKKLAPSLHEDLSTKYGDLLDQAIKKRVYKVETPTRDDLCSLAETLGFLKAGPRDVIELHTAVLEKKCHGVPQMKSQAYIEEGRVLLLELMGYVVMFYRNFYVENKSDPL